MGKRSELPDVGSLLDAADPAPRLPKSPSGNNWLLPPSMQTAQAEAMANPPVVRQALVAAASRITTPDSFANPRQLIRVDGAPVIVHLLRGLQTSGIERAVITLGHAAQHIAEEVRKHAFGTMAVEFVWCEASSWKRGHASNILAARSMFAQNEPILLVMSDHIFDQRLVRRMVTQRLSSRTHATVLIDDTDQMKEWAKPGGVHCQAHCKHGHCGSLVKVCKGEAGLVSRIGKRLMGFDSLETGAYVVRPDLFDILHSLLVESIYCTLAEAMQVFAAEGQLSYVSVGDLDWFGEQTVASLPTPDHSSAVSPEWRLRALHMLRITSPHLVALTGYINANGEETTVPLYELGSTIGSGCSSVVIQAQRGSDRRHQPVDGSASPASRRRRADHGLAVKVIRKGNTEALGDVERSVMWEVHVLQQLSHNHIVRVMDVIEVVDATYIIMQRVDGPELTEYVQLQQHRRLAPASTLRLFSHLLSALRHAHSFGFLHCDVKPDNVRLNKACDHAVLTDWGYARQPGERSEHYMCGTPAYASPEQLTGYSPDSVSGRRKLCPATDVWSLGVTLFEMAGGGLPFGADDYEALVRNVLAMRYRIPSEVPAPLATLIESMLQLAPYDRASVEELIESETFAQYGVVVPDPQGKKGGGRRGSGSGSFGDGRLLPAEICGDCEVGDSGLELAKEHGPSPPTLDKRVRKLLWTLLYTSLCVAAIWSQLAAPAVRIEFADFD